MLPIPSGPFRMGTGPEEEKILKKLETQTWDAEKPAHIVTLSAFEIGQYPVTNAEFRCFVEASGYDPEAPWWSPDGRRWRSRKWESDLSFYSEPSRQSDLEWLKERPAERRDRPFFWEDPRWNRPNLPVVGVCWFEAEAYANWLGWLTGSRFGLPTEAQWEKAARGPVDGQNGILRYNLWPWGDEWDPTKCNQGEEEGSFHQTSPVGMYPDGASPYGALDMAGNVWEWCLDWYAKDEYARRAGGEVLDPRGPQTGQARVFRGSSWFDDQYSCHCAARDCYGPDFFDSLLGFRLALFPG